MKDMILKGYVWAQIWRDENGQDMIEYALLAALIAVACIAGMSGIANKIRDAFNFISNAIVTTAT
jgi:pilus assembly protein Flp/PilA